MLRGDYGLPAGKTAHFVSFFGAAEDGENKENVNPNVFGKKKESLGKLHVNQKLRGWDSRQQNKSLVKELINSAAPHRNCRLSKALQLYRENRSRHSRSPDQSEISHNRISIVERSLQSKESTQGWGKSSQEFQDHHQDSFANLMNMSLKKSLTKTNGSSPDSSFLDKVKQTQTNANKFSFGTVPQSLKMFTSYNQSPNEFTWRNTQHTVQSPSSANIMKNLAKIGSEPHKAVKTLKVIPYKRNKVKNVICDVEQKCNDRLGSPKPPWNSCTKYAKTIKKSKSEDKVKAPARFAGSLHRNKRPGSQGSKPERVKAEQSSHLARKKDISKAPRSCSPNSSNIKSNKNTKKLPTSSHKPPQKTVTLVKPTLSKGHTAQDAPHPPLTPLFSENIKQQETNSLKKPSIYPSALVPNLARLREYFCNSRTRLNFASLRSPSPTNL